MAQAGQARSKLLEEILGKVGEDVFIEPPFYLDYGCNVMVGERFYAGVRLVLPLLPSYTSPRPGRCHASRFLIKIIAASQSLIVHLCKLATA